jgi:hypothetical protein
MCRNNMFRSVVENKHLSSANLNADLVECVILRKFPVWKTIVPDRMDTGLALLDHNT